jgi:MSHA biogenesis protein MshP
MTLPQRGFALMLAVFMIVTLAAIGVYLLTVSTAQVEAGTQEEQGTRAYQAARTGIEWGAFRVLRTPPCPPDTTLVLTGGLAGFFVRVQCDTVGNETEGTTTVDVIRITATGCNQTPCTPGAPTRTYVERQLQLTIVTN